MAVVIIDVDEWDTWRQGLGRVALDVADVVVHVEGLTAPVIGRLAAATDSYLLVEQPDDPREGGAIWIALPRVLAVETRYRHADVSRERRARIESDDSLLQRVREVAARHAEGHYRLGSQLIPGPNPRLVADELEDASRQDVQLAMEILHERGQLPGTDGGGGASGQP